MSNYVMLYRPAGPGGGVRNLNLRACLICAVPEYPKRLPFSISRVTPPPLKVSDKDHFISQLNSTTRILLHKTPIIRSGLSELSPLK